MRIRILSDLRLENQELNSHQFSLKDDNSDVTLIAGNISSDPKQAKEFLYKTFRKSVIILGNEPSHGDVLNNSTINDDIDAYRQTFHNSKRVRFLENDYVELNKKWIVIGCNFWTDLDLYKNKLALMKIQPRLPDYMYIQFKRYPHAKKRLLTPCDTYYLHTKSMEYLTKIVEKYKNKNVIILTHTAPSGKSLSLRSPENGEFHCSNCEDFILKHPNIKYWIHGQVDNSIGRCDYHIGKCRVICNPYENLSISSGDAVYSRDLCLKTNP